MSHTIYTLIATLLLTLLTACQPHQHPTPMRLEWHVMGTIAAIQCSHHNQAAAARDITRHAFESVNSELSHWHPATPLSTLNSAAGSPTPHHISPLFANLMTTTLELTHTSKGAFNPLVGPLMHLWGFNGATPPATLPTDTAIQHALTLANYQLIEFTPHQSGAATLRLPLQGMSLDLGAIAKGYAVDLAWQNLSTAGHTNLLIDLGGNLRALGEAAPGRQGWHTGVRNPFNPDSMAATFLLESGAGTASSGHYERFVSINNQRYAHILDPRTGYPVTNTAAVTVIAPNATLADGLSTTLFVLGPTHGTTLLHHHYPDCHALWIPDTPHTPTIIATPGMLKLLHPLPGWNLKQQ